MPPPLHCPVARSMCGFPVSRIWLQAPACARACAGTSSSSSSAISCRHQSSCRALSQNLVRKQYQNYPPCHGAWIEAHSCVPVQQAKQLFVGSKTQSIPGEQANYLQPALQQGAACCVGFLFFCRCIALHSRILLTEGYFEFHDLKGSRQQNVSAVGRLSGSAGHPPTVQINATKLRNRKGLCGRDLKVDNSTR